MPLYPLPNIPIGRPIVAGTTWLTLPGVVALSVATAAQAANFVRYFPIITQTPIVIDQLSVEITTPAAAGKLFRVGIYNADINWQPTSLIVDSGNQAADAGAVVNAAIAATPLAPGRYLLCWNTDGTPTVRTVRGTIPSTALIPTLGASPLMFSLRGTQAFGALPATGTVADTATGNTVNMDYWVFPRVSTP